MNLVTNTIYVSRNVVFHESVFPFHKEHSSPDYSRFFDQDVLPLPVPDSPFPAFFDLGNDISDPSLFVDPSSNLSVLNSNDHIPNTSSSSQHSTSSSVNPLPGTRSKHQTKTPAYLDQYHCFLLNQLPSLPVHQTHTTSYPISSFLSYDKFDEEHRNFILSITTNKLPHTFKEAMLSEEFRNSMRSEMSSLEDSGTWSVRELPPGKQAVGCKWIQTIKYNPDGTIERHKSRVVAKCYTQLEGLDYLDTFSPVAKIGTFRLLMALAAAKGWSITQLDVSNAFLNGDLDEEIYMHLPQGYEELTGKQVPSNSVCKLHKSLYGLMQASRQWNHKLSEVILGDGFTQTHSDHSLFIKYVDKAFLAVLVYVYDILVVGTDDSVVTTFKMTHNQLSSFVILVQPSIFWGSRLPEMSQVSRLIKGSMLWSLLKKHAYLGANLYRFLWNQMLNFRLLLALL